MQTTHLGVSVLPPPAIQNLTIHRKDRPEFPNNPTPILCFFTENPRIRRHQTRTKIEFSALQRWKQLPNVDGPGYSQPTELPLSHPNENLVAFSDDPLFLSVLQETGPSAVETHAPLHLRNRQASWDVEHLALSGCAAPCISLSCHHSISSVSLSLSLSLLSSLSISRFVCC